MAEWQRVRIDTVVVGRICSTSRGWVAFDDRHGEARISLHDTQGQAEHAVIMRSSKSAKQLDTEAAEIVDRIREIRRMSSELDGPINAHRVAEILARANEIGRSWDA